MGLKELLIVFLVFQPSVLAKQPNFVIILTDDQDLLLDGVTPMVQTNLWYKPFKL